MTRLALLLVLGSTARGRWRAMLVTLGFTVAMVAGSAALAVPSVVHAMNGRLAARAPRTGAEHSAPLLVATVHDYIGTRPLTRVTVARVGAKAPVPPGLTALPGPGQVAASPGLIRLAQASTAARARVRGRVVATIGPAGLTRPGELVEYIGTRPAAMRNGSGVTAFGDPRAVDPLVPHQELMLIYVILGLFVGLPLVILLLVCTTLSAASRQRRNAALRLAAPGRSTSGG